MAQSQPPNLMTSFVKAKETPDIPGNQGANEGREIPPFPGIDAVKQQLSNEQQKGLNTVAASILSASVKEFTGSSMPLMPASMHNPMDAIAIAGELPPPPPEDATLQHIKSEPLQELALYAVPSPDISSMPEMLQLDQLAIGPGAEREAHLLGVGLPNLSHRQEDDMSRSKKYAMEQSVKQVLLKQTVSHQANQKVAMYAQALSLMGRVYIGSISFEVKEESLRTVFSPFGPIKTISMSYDTVTGHHKGFAFLEFDVPEAALLAQEQMNGTLMGSRNIKVGRPSNMPQAQPIIEAVMSEAKQYHRIYVASVHQDLTEEDIGKVFEAFGTVKNVQLASMAPNNKNHSEKWLNFRGYGYIEFDHEQSCIDAVNSMNLFDLGGQYLRVGRAVTPPAALTYIVPTATQQMPTAAAVAAAAITAKIQSIETTPVGGAASATGIGLQPGILRGDATADDALLGDARRAGDGRGGATFVVEQPGVAIPESSSPIAGGVSPHSPSPSQRRSKFGGFAATVPPPSVATPPPLLKNDKEEGEEKKQQQIDGMTAAKKRKMKPKKAKKKRKKKQEEDQEGDEDGGEEEEEEDEDDAESVAQSSVVFVEQQNGAAEAGGPEVMEQRQDGDENEEATSSQEAPHKPTGPSQRELLMQKLLQSRQSTVLCLKNMVGEEDVDEYLEEEIQEECSKYGKVVQVVVYKEQQGEGGNATVMVKIFVKFSQPAEAEKGRSSLEGRYFAGRQIKADIYDETLFAHGDLTG